jgi:flagellar protein FliO/FliZ
MGRRINSFRSPWRHGVVKQALNSSAHVNVSFTNARQIRRLSRTEARGAMDILDWAKSLFALIATLALIGLAAYGARYFGVLGAPGRAGAERRLKVVESLMLDPRRRLVIVRCDEREHLLLLSPSGDVALPKSTAEAQT